MEKTAYFETRDEWHFHFAYSNGGVSRFFREIVDNQQLYVTHCPRCGRRYCPPRANCPTCHGETEWEPHPGTGTVVSAVYCYWTPSDCFVRKYVELPYVYALVRLDGVANCLNTLVHSRDLRLNKTINVGTRVGVRFRAEREGKISDFYFMPLAELEALEALEA